jgi:hypothetical protein
VPFDYKQNYDAELAQREHLRSAVGTPIGLLTLIGSALAFMVQKLRVEADWTTALFLIVAACSAAALVCATYCLIRALHGHTYRQLESALQLQLFHRELREWHSTYGNGVLAADREFEQHLQRRYAATADHNAHLNEKRADYLFLTTRRIILAGVFAGGALIPFGLNLQLQAEPPQRIEIANPVACVLMTPRGTDMEVAQMRPAPPPKPTPAPIRELTEGQIAKRPRPARR